MKAPVAHDGYAGVAKGLLRWALLGLGTAGVGCFLTSGAVALLFDSGDQKADRAELDITNINASLASFSAKTGTWPSESGWAQALVEAQILAHEPLDPWDHPYQYRLASPDGGAARPVVTSAGRDGEPGTDDDLPRPTSMR
ncbi:MAG: type II secretion system protein GspG [Archangium sp.]|nr:type II secretion system protein GspG [Archangium sp.]